MVAHNVNRKRSSNEGAGVTWPSDERGAMLYRVKNSNPNLISSTGYCSAGDETIIGSAGEPCGPNLHTNDTNCSNLRNELYAAKGRSIVEARKQREIFNGHCSGQPPMQEEVSWSEQKAPPPTSFKILDCQDPPPQNYRSNCPNFNHRRENSFRNNNEQHQPPLNFDRPIFSRSYHHDHCCPSSYSKFCRYFGGGQQFPKNNNMASWPDVFSGHYSDSAAPHQNEASKIFDRHPFNANKLMEQSINNNNTYYYRSSTNEMDDGKSGLCKSQNLGSMITAEDKKKVVGVDDTVKKDKAVKGHCSQPLLVTLTSTLTTGMPALLFSIMEFQMLLTLLNESHTYDNFKDSRSNDKKSQTLLFYFCLVVCSFCLSISIITALCSFFRCYVCINLYQQKRKWNLVEKSCLHSILDICFFISIFCFLAALVIFMHLSSTTESTTATKSLKMQSLSNNSINDQRFNSSMKMAPVIVICVLLGVGALICISLTVRAIYHRLRDGLNSSGVENSDSRLDECSEIGLSLETSDFRRNDKLSTLV